MNSKLMAQTFSDAISSSKSPVVVNGEIYKRARGYINLTDELIEALLYAQKELHCKYVKFGTYDCYEDTMHGFPVDGCLVGEINRLNNDGIKTIGCCCGHARQQGYIQVSPEFCDKMIELGYEKLPIKSEMYATWCFKPKTVLPQFPESAEDYFKSV
jgi:hypothetical protein